MSEIEEHFEKLLTARRRQRWLTAAFSATAIAAAVITFAPGCSIGSPVHVEVFADGQIGRFKSLEILSEDGSVVMRADADDDGNGRVTFFDAEQNVTETLPQS